jgi:hypothetical protein
MRLSPVVPLIMCALAASRIESQKCPKGLAYLGLQGKDTAAIETVTFTGSEFASVLRGAGPGPLLSYHGTLGPDGLVKSVTVDVWQVTADSAGPPAQHAIVSFSGKVMTALVAAPSRGIQSQRDSIPEGALPFMAGATVFLELLNRRSRYLGTPSGIVSIPVIWLFTGGALDSVRIHTQLGSDIAIELAQARMMGRTDSDGRLLSLRDGKGWTLRQIGCSIP